MGHGKLFSEEMSQNGEIVRKDIETARKGSTKFGFAIKYVLNGSEKAIKTMADFKEIGYFFFKRDKTT